MPTKAQIQIVQIARRDRQLNEPQYRMLLANVAAAFLIRLVGKNMDR